MVVLVFVEVARSMKALYEIFEFCLEFGKMSLEDIYHLALNIVRAVKSIMIKIWGKFWLDELTPYHTFTDSSSTSSLSSLLSSWLAKLLSLFSIS